MLLITNETQTLHGLQCVWHSPYPCITRVCLLYKGWSDDPRPYMVVTEQNSGLNVQRWIKRQHDITLMAADTGGDIKLIYTLNNVAQLAYLFPCMSVESCSVGECPLSHMFLKYLNCPPC